MCLLVCALRRTNNSVCCASAGRCVSTIGRIAQVSQPWLQQASRRNDRKIRPDAENKVNICTYIYIYLT